ncbi:MAG: HYR domain-containing protein, partial [Bacteroidota bacterium]
MSINPSQVLTNFSSLPQSCQDSFQVFVTNENDVFIAQGPVVVLDLSIFNPNVGIGDSLKITVFKDTIGGTFQNNEPNCWGGARLEDKLAPEILNCNDVTIYCNENLENIQGGAIPLISVTDNCTNPNNITLTLADSVLTTNTCTQNPYVKATLVKQWIASDPSGNTDTCTQTITILRLPVDNVIIESPSDTVLSCNVTNPPDTSAAQLGYPIMIFDNFGNLDTIELNPANLTGLCSDIKIFYEDITFQGGNFCGGEEKFIRTFKVFDCCDNSFVDTVLQTVEIKDMTAPVLNCPADLTVGTTSNSCGGNVILSPVAITDNCSNANFNVSIQTPVGTLNTNGGTITNVPLGTYTITYEVEDECGNMSSCDIMLTVIDNIVPTVICDEFTVIALNNLGQGLIQAETFDDGSTDNCGIASYEARRMTSDCSAETPFAPIVPFTCCDVGDTIMVELKITDEAGNMNFCMVEVEVQDKLDPIIICPSDKTIECGTDTSAATLGIAIGTDNCGIATIESDDIGNLDLVCGTGVFQRVWTVTDVNDLTTSCIQTITIVNSDPYSGDSDPTDVDDIIWPADVLGNDALPCIDYQSDPSIANPSNTGFPTLIGVNEDCSDVANPFFEDFVFAVNGGNCTDGKILRKWTVVDWCQVGNNQDISQPGPGVWIHTQKIMISDEDAPEFVDIPTDLTVNVDNTCNAAVNLQAPAIVDCNPNATVSITHDLGGNGFGVFNVGLGNYQVVYLLDDGCGNTATDTINISVEDDIAPTPVCNAVSSTLMEELDGSGSLTLPATAFISSSAVDNCTGNANLEYFVVLNILNDLNNPPTSSEVTFGCSNVGPSALSDVAVWACDTLGNCSFCVVEVEINDPSGVCTSNASADIAGVIEKEIGDGIEEVEVYINNGQYMEMTNSSGYFNIPNLQSNSSYSVKPQKTDNARNGITTLDIVLVRKHILGIELLDSPYKIIASDVNGSGDVTALDLVHIRNLILLNTNKFPNGTPSWKFVDANYVFSNPSDPLSVVFPEEVNIQNLSTNVTELDFVAVKMGDVSGNAIPNLLSSETRNYAGQLNFMTTNKTVKKGEVVKLSFQTDSEKMNDLMAWQYTLSFDVDALELVSFNKRENVHFSTANVGSGSITLCWNDYGNVLLKDKLLWFEIQFIAKDDISVKNALSINSKFTPAIGYNLNYEEIEINLNFKEENTLAQKDEFILFGNTPNPFTETTLINFYSPKKETIEITVYDMTGKLLKAYETSASKGKQSFLIRREDFMTSGLIYY